LRPEIPAKIVPVKKQTEYIATPIDTDNNGCKPETKGWLTARYITVPENKTTKKFKKVLFSKIFIGVSFDAKRTKEKSIAEKAITLAQAAPYKE